MTETFDNVTHEWVENLSDYEFVLKSIGTQGSFNANAVIRGFQTWGWNNASTPGNDETYAHGETGCMLKYDGEYVAFLPGCDESGGAFTDLFGALISLEWSAAEVYHPIETMGTLIQEMARSIPAAMAAKFDIKPAKLSGVSDSPRLGGVLIPRNAASRDTGEADIASGFAALHAQVVNAGGNSGASWAGNGRPIESAPAAKVNLADSLDDLGATPPSLPTLTRRVNIPSFPDDGELPVIPNLHTGIGNTAISMPPLENELNQSSPQLTGRQAGHDSALVTELAKCQNALIEMTAARDAAYSRMSEVVRSVEEKEDDWLLRSNGLNDMIQSLNLEVESLKARLANHTKLSELPIVHRVGVSGFCFEGATKPLGTAVIERIATESGCLDVRHLYPGDLHSDTRWDIAGDVVPDSPWFAEKICECFTAINISSFLGANSLGLRAALPASAAINLTPPGSSFVDIDVSDTSQVFTVHQVAQSVTPALYVIHRDSMDGPFIQQICDLLEWIVNAHSASTRLTRANIDSEQFGAKS